MDLGCGALGPKRSPGEVATHFLQFLVLKFSSMAISGHSAPDGQEVTDEHVKLCEPAFSKPMKNKPRSQA